MSENKEMCPYKVGDTVVYRPSRRGHELSIMIDPQYEIGKAYKIVRIVKDVYLVLEGMENVPGGGRYWTDFSPE